MRSLAVACVVAISSASASHAISVSTAGPTLANALAAETLFLTNRIVVAQEDFETGFTDGSRSLTYTSAVGTFTDNDPRVVQGGTGLGILTTGTTPFDGRFNTTGAAQWLDSFDSRNVTLDLNLPSNATGIGFFMTDLDDQGADTQLSLLDSIGGVLGTFDLTPSSQGSGAYWYVSVLFHGADVASLQWTLTDNNDGWGVDGFTAVAPIPLPAAGFLLLGGLAALAGVGRRRA